MTTRCQRCGTEFYAARRRLCDRCRKRRTNRRKPHTTTTTQRGYGAAHQKLRKRVAQVVASGGAVCWRCRRPIAPGAAWDLGHDDNDRSIYRGPEHSECNRATNARDRRAKAGGCTCSPSAGPCANHSRVW